MNVQNKAPSRRSGNAMKKSERVKPEELLKKIVEDHKERVGDVICIRIDSRTSIELPAHLSEEKRVERVNNYIRNANLKAIK